MIIFKSFNKLNKIVNFKANIGFVPPMGALHDGHISLIKSSKKNCEKTLVSIFVNPSQFNKRNDLKNYPRNLDKDIKILKKNKVKLSNKYSIIVNMGPGSYSSIRISLSVAKGIQIVHGSKLYGYKNNQLPELKLENIEILIKNKQLKNKMINPIYE